MESELHNITTIIGASDGFLALRADRKVVTWGNSDSSTVSSVLAATNVTGIFSIDDYGPAFAHLENGSVVIWGGYDSE